jgi:hypothetical protein
MRLRFLFVYLDSSRGHQGKEGWCAISTIMADKDFNDGRYACCLNVQRRRPGWSDSSPFRRNMSTTIVKRWVGDEFSESPGISERGNGE